MTFKAGDRVRYKDGARNREWHGWEGVVNWSQGSTTNAKTHKGSIPGKEVNLTTDNLELIEKPFTYDDIQVGDKIRRTLTRESGTTEVREGVVTKMGKCGELALDDGVPTSSSYILAYATDTHKETVVLELLDRPKPKHWTETKPVGSVGVILDGQFTKTITKVNEGEWRVYYSIDGFNYTDANPHVKARTADLDEAKLHWIK